MTIEEATKDWPAARVTLRINGQPIEAEPRVRTAVWLFDTPSGFVWLEDSYADPYGAGQNSERRVRGRVWQDGLDWRFQTADWTGIVSRFDPGPGWAAFILQTYGRTLAEERVFARELAAQSRAEG